MKRLSRRSFLAASATLVAGPGFAAPRQAPAPAPDTRPANAEVIIIGAGAAGIAAARRLAAAGKRCVLLEAADAIGGRCVTDTRTFGVPYDRGAHWIYAADLNPGQIQLKESLMKLRFRLLHEEDLTRFLGILARQGAGIYTVDQCAMRRLTTGTAVIRYQPNLSAECELAWITAKIGPSEEQKK